MKLKSTLSIPSVNNYWKPKVQNIRGKCRFAGMYITEEGQNFKQALFLLAKSKGFEPLNGDVKIKVTVYCKLKGAKDLDNQFKALQDSLEGVAYIKDSQIVEIVAKKVRY